MGGIINCIIICEGNFAYNISLVNTASFMSISIVFLLIIVFPQYRSEKYNIANNWYCMLAAKSVVAASQGVLHQNFHTTKMLL